MSNVVLGIDIAKKTFDVALLRADKYRHKKFANNSEGFNQLQHWLIKQGVEQSLHACMEATGNYGEDLALCLANAGHNVSIVNPSVIHNYAKSLMSRNKTDKKDASIIAQYCASQKPRIWQAPALEVRQLQALVRRMNALIEMRSEEKNRLDVAKEEIVINSIKAHIKYLDEQIAKTKAQIKSHLDNHPELKEQTDLLLSIKGIGDITAAVLLAEIVNVNNYKNAKQLAAYAGLSPRQEQSGTSVKKITRLSKMGNSKLRSSLFFPAMSAKKHNPLIAAFCQRLASNGKSKMAIVGAAMRKLLHIAYGVLKSGKRFDPHYQATGTLAMG